MHNNYEMDYTKMDALFGVDETSGPKRPGQVVIENQDSKKRKDVEVCIKSLQTHANKI